MRCTCLAIRKRRGNVGSLLIGWNYLYGCISSCFRRNEIGLLLTRGISVYKIVTRIGRYQLPGNAIIRYSRSDRG